MINPTELGHRKAKSTVVLFLLNQHQVNGVVNYGLVLQTLNMIERSTMMAVVGVASWIVFAIAGSSNPSQGANF